MIPSVTGLPYDPRDGEIDPAEWCREHWQRADSCGKCAQIEIERDLTELQANAAEDALCRAFRAALDRIEGETR